MNIRKNLSLTTVLGTCAFLAGALGILAAPALAAEEFVFSTSFGSPSLGVAVNQSTGQVYAAVEGGGVDVFEASGAPAATPQLTGASFVFPYGVAVDNSAQLSKGDIYVADYSAGAVDQFDLTGAATAVRVTEASIPLADQGNGSFLPTGVAVNSSGDLYVMDSSNSVVDEFSPAGVFIAQVGSPAEIEEGKLLAINSANDLYVAAAQGVVEFDSSGGCVNSCTPVVAGGHVGLAVDGAGDLFVGEGAQVSEYNAAGSLLGQLGGATTQPAFGGLNSAFGLALNDKTHSVYVADVGLGVVDIFFVSPVHAAPASEVGETSATLHGSVNPEGETLTECYFEYGPSESYGQSAPCAPTPTGTSFTPVSAPIVGLQPHTTYHFHLVINGPKGIAAGPDRSLYTFSRPGVEDEPVSNVGSTAATVSAQVNPGGSLSTYYVEYGTSTSYGSSTPSESLGAGEQAAGVLVQLSGLQPQTTYHFRVVASNNLGVEHGGDLSFITLPAPSAAMPGLPDGRGYEMVSPVANADGNIFEPRQLIATSASNDRAFGNTDGGYGEISGGPFRSSADGDAAEYVAAPLAVGGQGTLSQGNKFVATRDPAGGWTATDLATPGLDKAPFEALFSSELSNSGTSAVPAGSNPLSEVQGDLLTGEGKLEKELAEDIGRELVEKKKREEEIAKLREEGAGVFNLEEAVRGLPRKRLYESTGAGPNLVAVLPDGVEAPQATFGGEGGSLSHVISADGSHVFWTDLDAGPDENHIYVRENGNQTVAVSVGAAQFWTASTDGRYVFYTEDEKLWRFDVENETREELAGPGASGGAGVQGVIGANETGEDGSYVYFVAGSVLSENENAQGERAQPQTCEYNEVSGGTPCNLYVHHDDVTIFIAKLAGSDSGGTPHVGDATAELSNRTAEVTPDGRNLIFMSRASLTGYDNRDATSGEMDEEVFVYDADTARISCVSCNPTGAPPTGKPSLPLNLPSTGNPSTFIPRWISDDGTRAFFNSTEALVAQDTNGKNDVYEWEREGAGSCAPVLPARPNGGCIYLLSGGTSTDNSFLMETSASGNDVFFISRAQLVPQDQGETFEVYDAHVGASEPPVEAACTGTGCQGLPAAPPPFATPSSVTFNGIGNFPPSAPTKRVTKKIVKCAKGKKLSHNKCVKVKSKKKKEAKKARRITTDRRTK